MHYSHPPHDLSSHHHHSQACAASSVTHMAKVAGNCMVTSPLEKVVCIGPAQLRRQQRHSKALHQLFGRYEDDPSEDLGAHEQLRDFKQHAHQEGGVDDEGLFDLDRERVLVQKGLAFFDGAIKVSPASALLVHNRAHSSCAQVGVGGGGGGRKRGGRAWVERGRIGSGGGDGGVSEEVNVCECL